MIRISGVEKALTGLREVCEEAAERVAEVLEESAGELADRARGYAPARTGRLRESIGFRRLGRGRVVVEASAPYAGYVEFGTSRTPPRRFIQRALEETLDRLKTRLAARSIFFS
ncbi:MAG: HK97 gp10 family phage protein [Candidatus Caldarchaeum sp.]